MENNTNRIQTRYNESDTQRTIIDTYNRKLARALTEELIDQVVDISYNNHSFETIDLICKKSGIHRITMSYKESKDDVIICVDGFAIMPFELDDKLIDIFE